MSLSFELGTLLTRDVEGAPVAIDQLVRLACQSGDATFDQRFSGCAGRVRGLIYDASEQYPDDPLILVEVDAVGSDLFFAEELTLRALKPARRAWAAAGP